METRQVLLTRRSVRKYKSDPIPETDLVEILEAASCAPSAINLQHWYFAAVTSPEEMATLREIMGRVPTLPCFGHHPVGELREDTIVTVIVCL